MGRINFVTHKGKQILHIDFSNVAPDDAPAVVEEAKRVIARQPPNSLRTLTDITNGGFPPKVNQLMKEYTTHNKPYVRAAAIVGADGLRKALVYVVATFSGRDLKPFDSAEQAKEWLAEF